MADSMPTIFNLSKQGGRTRIGKIGGRLCRVVWGPDPTGGFFRVNAINAATAAAAAKLSEERAAYEAAKAGEVRVPNGR